MLILSLVAAISASATAYVGDAAESEQERTIVLFGASWCAPCRIELRQLSRLAALTAPDRITLAWLDRRPRIPQSGDGIRVLVPAEARALFDRVPGNQGVPLAAMFDGAGRLCAYQPEALHRESLARLRAACGQSQPREAASALAPLTRKSVSLPASTRS
jgi:thiol-disulfide isomerase/thioredoxin